MRRGEREQQRKALTSMVRSYIAQQRASGNAGLVLLDLEKEFDYANLPEGRRRQVNSVGAACAWQRSRVAPLCGCNAV